jgi:quinolinate synthase
MKMITIEKIYKSLKFEEPEITVDPEIIERAAVPIKRMLEISAKLGL